MTDKYPGYSGGEILALATDINANTAGDLPHHYRETAAVMQYAAKIQLDDEGDQYLDDAGYHISTAAKRADQVADDLAQCGMVYL